MPRLRKLIESLLLASRRGLLGLGRWIAMSSVDFLRASADQQDRCATVSRSVLSKLSPEFRRLVAQIGKVLYLTDGLASCLWGCHGKEHVIENLVGRAESNSRAAFRLIEFGQYDEALSLIRNVAEIANLIWLFYTDPTQIRTWLDLPEEEREKQYLPHMVKIFEVPRHQDLRTVCMKNH